MSEKKNYPVVEAALESTEVIADILTDDDVLSGVPVVGTAIRLCKAKDSIRDRSLALKLSKFLDGIKNISTEKRFKLKEKIKSNNNEARKVGESLYFVLERMTDLEKPIILAYLFIAYIDEIITADELRRLSQVIDTAFSDDLKRLLINHKLPEKSDEQWMQYLTTTGLTKIVASQIIDDLGKIFYEFTPLANKLRNAYYHGRKESKTMS